MTQKQLPQQGHHSMGDSSGSWAPAAGRAARWRVLPSCLGWPKPLPGSWLPSDFSQQSGLSNSSLQLDFSEMDSQLLLIPLAGRGLVNLASFRDFLKLYRVVYFLLKKFSGRMECFILRENCWTKVSLYS